MASALNLAGQGTGAHYLWGGVRTAFRAVTELRREDFVLTSSPA
ncbi:hypothetical protein [Actinomadura sp. HBU206391]|nr:hypothetical protein [Actinomadura sp. HBU206391]